MIKAVAISKPRRGSFWLLDVNFSFPWSDCDALRIFLHNVGDRAHKSC